MIYPEGRLITYELDNTGRVSRVTTTKGGSPVTLAENITYKPFGPIAGMTLGSGLSVSFSYDELYRLTGTVAGTVQSLSFAPLDPVGNVELITNNLDTNRNQSFVDDDLCRLTGASGIYGSIGFTYDDIGNRLTRTENSQTDTYSYETNTSLLSSITGVNPATFTYDESGYLVHEGRDIAGSGSLILATYAYNGIGQRIKKTAQGVTTIYHYDINGNLIAESAATGELNAAYVYLGSIRLATIIGENIYFHLNDHLGTLQKLIDVNNNVVWAADYLPFGKVNITVQNVVNNFRFAGQYYDAETGLHYNYHRYYDPKTGRYLTPDPIGLDGGINLYSYVVNNPINYIDPTGEIVFSLSKKVWDKILKKHILGTDSSGTLFNQSPSTVKKLIRNTINTGDEIAKGGKYGAWYIKDFKRPIGKNGETVVKVVIKDGSIRSAYPIAGAILGFLGNLLDPFGAISGELASGDLPDNLIYSENPCN